MEQNTPEIKNWPTNEKGHYICNKQNPMPLFWKHIGKWEHDNVHETDADSEAYIEYKCHSCGHVWRSEMPE